MVSPTRVSMARVDGQDPQQLLEENFDIKNFQ